MRWAPVLLPRTRLNHHQGQAERKQWQKESSVLQQPTAVMWNEQYYVSHATNSLVSQVHAKSTYRSCTVVEVEITAWKTQPRLRDLHGHNAYMYVLYKGPSEKIHSNMHAKLLCKYRKYWRELHLAVGYQIRILVGTGVNLMVVIRCMYTNNIGGF